MKRISLTPFELQLFLKVQDDRSFRSAAAAFGLSQPAVSRAVARLEERLGARLLDRDNRNVALTPQGREFVPIARRLVDELESSLGELADFFAGDRGRVTVAALPSAAVSLLPKAIAAFRLRQPGVVVRVADMLLAGVANAVASGEADFGIAGAPPTDAEGLAFEPILSDRFVAVMRAGHPLAAVEHLTWAALCAYPFIAMSPTTSVRPLTDAAFSQAGVTVTPAFEVSHLATAGALAAADLGVTAQPELALEAMARPDLVRRPLHDPSTMRPIGLITRVGRTLSPAAVAFMSSLRLA